MNPGGALPEEGREETQPQPGERWTRRRLVGASSSSLGRFVASAPAYFIGVPIYLSVLGKQEYGIWVLITTFTGWLYFTDFGLKTATMRAAARYGNDPAFDAESLNEHLMMVTSLYAVIIAAVLALLAAGLRPVLVLLLDIPPGLVSRAWAVVFLGVVAFLVDLVANGLLRAVPDGLGWIARSNAIAVAYTYARLALIVTAALVTRSVVVMSAAAVVASLIGLAVWRINGRKLVPEARYRIGRPSGAEFKHLARYAGVVQLNDLLSTSTPQIVEAIVVRRFGLEALALFDIGIQLSIYLRLAIVSVWAPVMPWLSGRAAEYRERVGETMAATRAASHWAVLLGLGATAAIGPFALGLWLGDTASGVVPMLTVLAMAGLAQGAVAPYIHLWNADATPQRTTVVLLALAVALAAIALLAPAATAVGALSLAASGLSAGLAVVLYREGGAGRGAEGLAAFGVVAASLVAAVVLPSAAQPLPVALGAFLLVVGALGTAHVLQRVRRTLREASARA